MQYYNTRSIVFISFTMLYHPEIGRVMAGKNPAIPPPEDQTCSHLPIEKR